MTPRCTPDLATHPWRCVERLLLSPWDVEGFAQVWLLWTCDRCGMHVWADGVVHTSTPAMSPAQWEAERRWQVQQGTLARRLT